MQFAFQDYDNLYLIMDLLNGGDLRYHISRHKRFSEEQTSNLIFTKVFSNFWINLCRNLFNFFILFC